MTMLDKRHWSGISRRTALKGAVSAAALLAAPAFLTGRARAQATIGGSTWRTSVFPDSKSGCYALPIKRAVRNAEGLEPGAVTSVTIELIDV